MLRLSYDACRLAHGMHTDFIYWFRNHINLAQRGPQRQIVRREYAVVSWMFLDVRTCEVEKVLGILMRMPFAESRRVATSIHLIF